jgi:hypothetical protein
MVDKGEKVHQAPSMSDAQIAALTAYCPDLDQWPQRWQVDAHDLPPGQRIVDVFTPFLLHLLDAGLAIKTLHRHRDNLWLLGGELIRRRYDDDLLKKMPIDDAIAHLIEEDGGPLIWPRITEAQQNSFDATCRKLFTFLFSTAKPV